MLHGATISGTCILCLTPQSQLTSEHIFPEAIGGGLEVPVVCSRCNSFLGSEVDVLLTDEPLIKMLRSGLALPSKTGEVPAPLHRGELAGEEGVLASLAVKRDGTHVIRPEMTREELLSPEGRQQVRIIGAPKEVEVALKKMANRAQRDGKQLVLVDTF